MKKTQRAWDWTLNLKAKKIYRLKEDQAFSLSLELGRREKVVRHPSADFLLHSIAGGGDFVDTVIAVKILQKGMRDKFVKTLYWKINSCIFLFKIPFTLLFKGIVSRASIFIKFCEVTSVHSCVRWSFALKGQCHNIFASGFFHESSSPEPLKICKFVDLKMCYICGPSECGAICGFEILDRIFFAICGFADPNLLRSYNFRKSEFFFSAYKYIPTMF